MATEKRRKGDGNIVWIARGKARIRIWLGDKRHSENFTGSKRDAERRLKELLKQKDLGTLALKKEEGHKVNPLTFGKLVAEWWEATDFSGRPKTKENYEYILRFHLLPKLENVYINDITFNSATGLVAKLRKTRKVKYFNTGTNKLVYGKEYLSPSTIHKIILLFKQIVRWGANTEKFPEMRWLNNIKISQRRENENNSVEYAFSSEEIKELLHHARETRYYPIILLAVNTGAHLSELMGLTWSDCDFDSETPYISLKRTLFQGKGGLAYYKPMKNEGRARKLSVPQHVAEHFQTYKKLTRLKLPSMGTMRGHTTLPYRRFDDMPLFVNTEVIETSTARSGIHTYKQNFQNPRNPEWESMTPRKLNRLIWKYPMRKVGEMYGISNRSVSNKAKKFDLQTPPVGYFLKKGETPFRHKAKNQRHEKNTRLETPPLPQVDPAITGGGLGDPWLMNGVSHGVKRLYKKIFTPDEFGEMVGIPEQADFKSLRHTHATLLILSGVDLAIVSERLGHSNIGTTKKHYLHLLNRLDYKVIDALDQLNFGADDQPSELPRKIRSA